MNEQKKERISRIRVAKEDKEIEKNDNMSIFLVVFIIGMSFIVGISVGYILYNMAINGAS